MQKFRLVSHSAHESLDIDIVGEILRVENQLIIDYKVTGDVGDILLPAQTIPARRDDLWKTTCFEFFLTISGHEKYWEFNMSPSGEWNVYRMDAYRRVGFREETDIQQLPFNFQNDADGYSLHIAVDLTPILPPEHRIQIGIAAVVQTTDGNESFWALEHPETSTPLPDFHLRESFVIEV